jgi:hypothetical protein
MGGQQHPTPKKYFFYEMLCRASDLEGFFSGEKRNANKVSVR